MMPIICETCEKEFKVFPSRSNQRFCSRSCGMEGKHNSLENEFTSDSLKQLWQTPNFRNKVLKARASSILFKNINKGRKLSIETRKKISDKLSGEGNYWYGRNHSDESKAKMSLTKRAFWLSVPTEKRKFSEKHKRNISRALSGERNPMYGKPNPNKKWREQFSTPEFQRKRLLALNHGPTKPEKKVIAAIKNCSLPFQYVGDGGIIINHLILDFIATDGKRKIMEVFGDYWHGKGADSLTDTEEGRKETFRQLGYDTLVLWEHELRQLSEEEIANRIRDFIGEDT